MLEALIPAPGTMVMRFPAAATSLASGAAPSRAVLVPPDVKILPAPGRTTSSSAPRRIEECSAARPDYREDGDVKLLAHGLHTFDAGRNSADAQVPAEFNAICAAALRGQRCLPRLDADFEQVSSLHFCGPEKRFKRV